MHLHLPLPVSGFGRLQTGRTSERMKVVEAVRQSDSQVLLPADTLAVWQCLCKSRSILEFMEYSLQTYTSRVQLQANSVKLHPLHCCCC